LPAKAVEPRPAEAGQQGSEEWFRALAESVPLFIWSARADGVSDYHNPQFLDYLGKRPEDMQGWAWAETLHPEDRERAVAAWTEAFRRGTEYAAEFRIRRAADGAYRWFDSRAFPLRDAQGYVVRWYGYVHDIHDRKLAEEAVREANRRKDLFVATLAHEGRSPLAAIENALEVVRARGPERRAAVREAWEIIDRQAGQLARLVDDLLDVSRLNQGKLRLARQPVMVATVVARAVEAARPLINARGQKLAVVLPGKSLLVEGDPVRLQQVLGNLLANSARYTPEGGHIWLTAERQVLDVVLRVRDDGIGIAPEVLPQIFDLFVQGKRAQDQGQGGLGIGLALVKSLVELHGGRVGASSPGPGQGSEFWVRLPTLSAVQEEVAATHRPREESVSARPPCRVLVVDDSRDAADSLALLLRVWGHEVRVTYDGPGALDAAREFRPDVLLLDLGLPGMTGYAVAEQLRQVPDLGQTILVAVTGHGQEGDRRRSEQAGFRHHLVKPADPNALRQLLAGLAAPPGTAP
jgi:two-component system CheB/CheR fusion protein